MAKAETEQVTAVLHKESAALHANLYDFSAPGAAVVMVTVGSPAKPVEGEVRGGWVLTAYSRKAEFVRMAEDGKKEFMTKYGHDNWWWSAWGNANDTVYSLAETAYTLPAGLHPHAAAFAAGGMAPGVFADALMETQSVPDEVSTFLMRPYREEVEE